jgi:hypothetical protein
MSEARYSQPIEPTPRDVGGPVMTVGFIGRGRFKKVAYIFRDEHGREKRVEATRSNAANERPNGFFASLARLFAGGPQR